MANNIIDGAQLRDMFLCAAKNLENNKALVNELNVYPVPDGDTGTNMTLTIQSALREIEKVKEPTAGKIANAVSMGALKGARGNSGVILSQLFRGFAKSVDTKEVMTVADMANALQQASDSAYKAVMKPSEGTILTVARFAAKKAMAIKMLYGDDPAAFFDMVAAQAKETLDATPDMLPVLKQAGVVDSGGMGFYCILVGFAMAFQDNVQLELSEYKKASAAKQEVNPEEFVDNHEDIEDIKFAYCTEFFVYEGDKVFPSDIENIFKKNLDSKGDSMLVINQDGIIKVHIHTNVPLEVLGFAMNYGLLQDVKVENMRLQFAERNKKAAEPEKEIGVVSVAAGKGIEEILRELNVDVIVSGGQTMNPSIDDIVKAVEKANAKHVFVFPNNKNIILAAQQAKNLCKCDVRIIPTRSVQQGISALISYDPDLSAEQNEQAFLEAVKNVVYGQITHSIRETNVEGLQVHQGDFIALINDKLKVSGPDMICVAKEMIDCMISDESSLVTVYYGEDATEEQAQELAAYTSEKYPDVDVEVYFGGQPVYNFLVSID